MEPRPSRRAGEHITTDLNLEAQNFAPEIQLNEILNSKSEIRDHRCERDPARCGGEFVPL